jgi:hypothetical protein
MAPDFEPGKKNSPKPRAALSSKTKNRIRELVGTCEYCGRETSPDQLNVYQLSPLAQPEYRKEASPANAVIVLCELHYNQVLEGQISKSSLKARITKRSDKKKKELRSVLQKRDRTYEGAGAAKIRDPSRFNVSVPGASDHIR